MLGGCAQDEDIRGVRWRKAEVCLSRSQFRAAQTSLHTAVLRASCPTHSPWAPGSGLRFPPDLRSYTFPTAVTPRAQCTAEKTWPYLDQETRFQKRCQVSTVSPSVTRDVYAHAQGAGGPLSNRSQIALALWHTLASPGPFPCCKAGQVPSPAFKWYDISQPLRVRPPKWKLLKIPNIHK